MPTRYYPLADPVPGVPGREQRDYRAVATAEFRPPKAGEWFISGAIPAGYRMPNDGVPGMPMRIARLVRVERIEVYREV